MPLTDLSSLASASATWLAADWKFLLGVFAVLGVTLWVRLRTGSSHMISKIIWRRLLGQRPTTGGALESFLDERDELMQFRWLTGLKEASTLAAAKRVADWARGHDLDFDTVSRAQMFLDFDKPGLDGKSPRLAKVRAVEAASVLLGALAALVLIVGAMTPAVVRVIASDLHYAVEPSRAQRLPAFWTGGGRGFNKSQCADVNAIVARTGYVKHDVEVLCKIFTDDEGLAVVGEARKAQSWLIAVFVGSLFVLSWVLNKLSKSAHAARALHARIAERIIARAEEFLARTEHLPALQQQENHDAVRRPRDDISKLSKHASS